MVYPSTHTHTYTHTHTLIRLPAPMVYPSTHTHILKAEVTIYIQDVDMSNSLIQEDKVYIPMKKITIKTPDYVVLFR